MWYRSDGQEKENRHLMGNEILIRSYKDRRMNPLKMHENQTEIVTSQPTKIQVVKAMIFPVVMYRCESWNIKLNAKELMLLNCGVGEDSLESLGQQGDPTSPS